MMGLFRRGNSAEKKLKKITGGFILNNDYMNKLKEHDLDVDDGIKIKNQVKEEIKQGKIGEHDVRVRINQLIKEYSKPEASSSQKSCPKCSEVQESSNAFCINCGFKFASDELLPHQIECPNCSKPISKYSNVCPHCRKKLTLEKTCPICNQKQDESNMYCINCGYDFAHKKVAAKKKRCPNCNRELFKKTMLCPYCNYDFEKREVRESETSEDEIIEYKPVPESTDFKRQIRFLNTFDFNLKACPECDTKFLKTDPFCFNCGCSVLTQDTRRNDNLEVKDGKLVGKTQNSVDDELSSLEALYNQTVQSKYAPGFKMAYVLYLEHFRKNPSKKFSDKTAKHYETTPGKLKKQAVEDAFIEPASPLAAAREFKVSELKEILKQYDLKVSGKKDELIERLGENLSDDELKKHFKSKNYQISEKGLEFLNKNSYILYILSDKDILGAFYPAEIGKIFEEKHYSDDEIQDKLVNYLSGMLDKKLTEELWVDFKLYSNALAQVLEDKGDLKKALNIRMKVFLFDVNNYNIVLNKPEPSKTRLKQKDIVKLTRLLHKLTLPVDELKELFDNAFNEALFKTVITSQDSLIYLLKVFGGEDLGNVSAEVNEKYSNPY